MGMFDTYGHVQLKVGPCELVNYEIGDNVSISDGLYIGYGGFVLIKNGKLLATEETVITSWGDKHTATSIIEKLELNPLIGVVRKLTMKEYKKQLKKKKKSKKK
jgi:hypothetical protein